MTGSEPLQPPTIATALAAARTRLAAAGIEEPAAESRRLVAATIDGGEVALIAEAGRALTSAEAERFTTLLDRRAAREPLARIKGVREFYGRPFRLNAATLEPRPDSETLIEAALSLVAEAGWQSRPIRILDIGTGTGCLLLSLLAELSPLALAAAGANATALGLQNRAAFEVRDCLEPAPGASDGPYDLVVSNPPYIPTAEISGLAPEVRDFDPRLALDGGADGLTAYRRILEHISRVSCSGWVVLEVGADQAAKVVDATMRPCRVFRDFGGHARVVAFSTLVQPRR
jgi:release factor glutamine methyltransferase